VGVNTAIIAMAQGLGFAIPSNTVQWVTTELLGHGRIRRRQLGITATVERLPRSVAREFDLLSDTVVRVIEVDPRGVAARSGIEPDDLIVALNDRITASVDDVHRLLTLIPSDVPLNIMVVRDGRRLEVLIDWK
jgi:S1-C subfamily serine protease